jgi:hypothetical protein
MAIDFIIKKISGEEGSSEPSYARLWIGILEFRDGALSNKFKSSQIEIYRNEFDTAYQPVLDAIEAMRSGNREIQHSILTHRNKILSGEIVQFQEHAVEVSESIDKLLRDSTANLLINGVIATKGSKKSRKFLALISDAFLVLNKTLRRGYLN